MSDADHSTDQLLTTNEVAERLRVSPRTVARLVTDGYLRSLKLPTGTLRYRSSDVEALLAGSEEVPQ